MDFGGKSLPRFSFLLAFVLAATMQVESRLNVKPSKLVVFGDSYVDTGNTAKSNSSSWNKPYGVTFPGKPSGRFSDGRVWTDFIARSFGLKSPIPYMLSSAEKNQFRSGINFAFGGTGIFNTSSPYPNMTAQIDIFEQLIRNRRYRPEDLAYSVALVAVSGNDHRKFLLDYGLTATIQEWEDFLQKVVNQTLHNVQRIHALGVNKIAVDALAPLGCIPEITSANAFTECDNKTNLLTQFYNQLLQVGISKLSDQMANASFVYIDLYAAFSAAMEKHVERFGGSQLKPCCVGMNASFSCGSVDDNGVNQYTVCERPNEKFFWDMVHPTQHGWRDVYLSLKSTLRQLRV